MQIFLYTKPFACSSAICRCTLLPHPLPVNRRVTVRKRPVYDTQTAGFCIVNGRVMAETGTKTFRKGLKALGKRVITCREKGQERSGKKTGTFGGIGWRVRENRNESSEERAGTFRKGIKQVRQTQSPAWRTALAALLKPCREARLMRGCRQLGLLHAVASGR